MSFPWHCQNRSLRIQPFDLVNTSDHVARLGHTGSQDLQLILQDIASLKSQILFSAVPIYEVTRYHKVHHLREIHLSSLHD